MPQHIYNPGTGLEEVESLIDGAMSAGRNGGAVLDSAAAADVATDIAGRSSAELPTRLGALLDSVEDEKSKARVVQAVLDGVQLYQQQHGVAPSADVIETAISQGLALADGKKDIGLPQRMTLDGIGSTAHHDPISAQPNRLVLAITSALAEAIPFATYLPTDIGSNEARLGIVSHQAGSTFGDYDAGALLDGVNIGDVYAASERRVPLTLNAERSSATGGIVTRTGGNTQPKLLRGRSQVFVNGFPAAAENPVAAQASAPTSQISGGVWLGGEHYGVSGTVAPATGAFNVTFTPALPAGTVVEAEGYIDYELQPELAPEIITQVQTFSLYAKAWRILMDQTIDSQTQYNNEIGMDLLSESLMAARNQIAMERHYSALKKLKTLAGPLSKEYNFDYPTQIAQKTRAQIWQDFSAVIGVVDQEMAERTMDHGITHLYVGKNVKAQLESLPAELWQGSGLTARPGIYRLGRLFGRYEVYYTPKVLVDAEGNSQILAIGRSPQVSRCPLVMGDAVPPTIIPLSIGRDLNRGQAIYARNFTDVNPHQPSAMGVALINITNLFG
ncbi:hypothetical protein [Stutzerimonas nitrititolerans]|uniref:hypothetical protein n=1 Tax=Stutzerimonas nitrititolerans TaxID=2482751 RepID=UPI0028A6D01D|nr:hypothetical protein [Stutzerimonas nitrititolerans]